MLFLYEGQTVALQIRSSNILSCFQYRPFVLKWSNNLIELEQADGGRRTLLSHVVQTPAYSTDGIHGLAVKNEEASDRMITRLGSKLCSMGNND